MASLASLISLRLYGKTERADSKAYFQWFFAANGIGLAVLLLTAWGPETTVMQREEDCEDSLAGWGDLFRLLDQPGN